MMELSRRQLSLAAMAGLLSIGPGTAVAQATGPLSFDDLRELYADPVRRARLMAALWLAEAAAETILFLKLTPRSLDDFRSKFDVDVDTRDQFFKSVDALTADDKVAKASAEDKIVSAAGVAVQGLVKSLKTNFEEYGLNPGGPMGRETLSAIYAYEQGRAVLASATPTKAWICNFYPFSWFCSNT